MINYYNYKITCNANLTEVLIAMFTTMPFEAYQELETGFHAYMPEDDCSEETDVTLNGFQESFDFSFEKEFVPYKNWNEEWEKNFEAVVVGDFCGIRADFHPPFENVVHDLVINPKMAFGTGHHETTHMMVEVMETFDFKNKKVLDFGCGTGILAILASRIHANPIDAVDIEIESYENTIENAERNGVFNIKTYQGSLEVIKDSDYDIILANINRNVILEYLPSLYNKVKKGGWIAFSGFLKNDENLLLENAKKAGFEWQSSKERGKWICQLYKK